MRQAPATSPMPWRDPAEVAAIEAAVLESRQRQARSVTGTGALMSENTNPSVARLRNIGNGMIREADELRQVGTDFLRWANEKEKEQASIGAPHSGDLPAERGGERALPIHGAAANAVANGTTGAHASPPGQ